MVCQHRPYILISLLYLASQHKHEAFYRLERSSTSHRWVIEMTIKSGWIDFFTLESDYKSIQMLQNFFHRPTDCHNVILRFINSRCRPVPRCLGWLLVEIANSLLLGLVLFPIIWTEAPGIGHDHYTTTVNRTGLIHITSLPSHLLQVNLICWTISYLTWNWLIINLCTFASCIFMYVLVVSTSVPQQRFQSVSRRPEICIALPMWMSSSEKRRGISGVRSTRTLIAASWSSSADIARRYQIDLKPLASAPHEAFLRRYGSSFWHTGAIFNAM